MTASATRQWPTWLTTQKGKKPVVEGKRRRQSGPQGSSNRERAATPQRRRESGGGSTRPPVSGGGGGSSFGTPRPPASGGTGGTGGGMQMPGGIGGIILLVIIVVGGLLMGTPLSGLLGGGGDAPQAGQPAVQQPAVVQATLPPAAAPADANQRKEWLIMLYADADDQVLERDIYVDVNEAERIGSTPDIHFVAQVDRFTGGYAADGDWTGTRRYYITRDDDLERIGSPVVQDIGEVNMADGQTLVDFITWAKNSYPADKYVLIMSDHGMGWPGGWSDPTAPNYVDRNIPLTQALGDKLYLHELDEALGRARQAAGIDHFELIGMDACLMAHMEVFAALQPHARYAVASQEVEPALGWAYTGFMETLARNPQVNGDALGTAIVDTYIVDDQRIVDDVARADFVRQGSPLGGLLSLFGGGTPAQQAPVSANELATQIGRDVTLTVVDLQTLPQLTDSLNALSFAMQSESQPTVARARTYAQSFTNVFSRDLPSAYIDLGHFAELLGRESGNATVRSAANAVIGALGQTVIAEKHGPQKPGATGISLYFPTSQLYDNAATGLQSYVPVAKRFADTTLWDDFLAYHYAGRPFAAVPATASVTTRAETVTAPGAGELAVGPVTASADAVDIRDTVTLSADISGSNIAYVHLFVGFLDRDGRSIYIADSDFIESRETRELSGVTYPVWPEDETFELRFDWEPIVYAISNGAESVSAHLVPQTFGATVDNATYTVDGYYRFADGSSEARYARLTFDNTGYLRTVYAYTGGDDLGSPWEVTPAVGDSFTVIEEWLDVDESGVSTRSTQPGGTLTFNGDLFYWEELDAAAGEYVVGFVVTDLDGQRRQALTSVTVR